MNHEHDDFMNTAYRNFLQQRRRNEMSHKLDNYMNRIPLPADTRVECHVCGDTVDVTDALPLDENDRSGGWICDRCGLLEADRVWEKYDDEIEAGLDRGEFSQEEINRLGDIGERLDNWNTAVFAAAAAKFDDGPAALKMNGVYSA